VECRDERRTKKTPGLERWATGGALGEEEKGYKEESAPLTRIFFPDFAKIKGTKIDGSLKDLKTNLNNLNLEKLIVVGNKISNINQNTLITVV
jgi:hypothetical protein